MHIAGLGHNPYNSPNPHITRRYMADKFSFHVINYIFFLIDNLNLKNGRQHSALFRPEVIVSFLHYCEYVSDLLDMR